MIHRIFILLLPLTLLFTSALHCYAADSTKENRETEAAAYRVLGVPAHASSHSILGVTSSATAAEIKKAYRKMCQQHHPDRFAQDQKQQTIQNIVFLIIQGAYDELTGKGKRRWRPEPAPAPQQAQQHESRRHLSFEDYLENMRAAMDLEILIQNIERKRILSESPHLHHYLNVKYLAKLADIVRTSDDRAEALTGTRPTEQQKNIIRDIALDAASQYLRSIDSNNTKLETESLAMLRTNCFGMLSHMMSIARTPHQTEQALTILMRTIGTRHAEHLIANLILDYLGKIIDNGFMRAFGTAYISILEEDGLDVNELNTLRTTLNADPHNIAFSILSKSFITKYRDLYKSLPPYTEDAYVRLLHNKSFLNGFMSVIGALSSFISDPNVSPSNKYEAINLFTHSNFTQLALAVITALNSTEPLSALTNLMNITSPFLDYFLYVRTGLPTLSLALEKKDPEFFALALLFSHRDLNTDTLFSTQIESAIFDLLSRRVSTYGQTSILDDLALIQTHANFSSEARERARTYRNSLLRDIGPAAALGSRVPILSYFLKNRCEHKLMPSTVGI